MHLKGENCLKRLIPKNVASITIQKVAIFDSDHNIFHNIFIFFVYNALKMTIFCLLGVSPSCEITETSRAETPGGHLIIVKITGYIK